jgi:hypothetical protein
MGFEERYRGMLDKAITGLQIVCMLAIMVRGFTFLLSGFHPPQFVALVYTAIGAITVYLLLAGVDRVVA